MRGSQRAQAGRSICRCGRERQHGQRAAAGRDVRHREGAGAGSAGRSRPPATISTLVAPRWASASTIRSEPGSSAATWAMPESSQVLPAQPRRTRRTRRGRAGRPAPGRWAAAAAAPGAGQDVDIGRDRPVSGVGGRAPVDGSAGWGRSVPWRRAVAAVGSGRPGRRIAGSPGRHAGARGAGARRRPVRRSPGWSAPVVLGGVRGGGRPVVEDPRSAGVGGDAAARCGRAGLGWHRRSGAGLGCGPARVRRPVGWFAARAGWRSAGTGGVVVGGTAGRRRSLVGRPWYGRTVRPAPACAGGGGDRRGGRVPAAGGVAGHPLSGRPSVAGRSPGRVAGPLAGQRRSGPPGGRLRGRAVGRGGVRAAAFAGGGRGRALPAGGSVAGVRGRGRPFRAADRCVRGRAPGVVTRSPPRRAAAGSRGRGRGEQAVPGQDVVDRIRGASAGPGRSAEFGPNRPARHLPRARSERGGIR